MTAATAATAVQPIGDEALAEVLRLAEAATPGPWVVWPNSPTYVREDTANGWGVLTHFHRTEEQTKANAAYIAAANPATVQAMGARIAAVDAECGHGMALIGELTARAESAEAERARLRAALEGARAVLSFYADPPSGTAVPDFYDELDFGSRAAEFLRANEDQSPAAAERDHLVDALRPFAWAGELMAAQPTTVKCVPDLQPGDPSRCGVLTIVAGDIFRVLELRHFWAAMAALLKAEPNRYGHIRLWTQAADRFSACATCKDDLQVAQAALAGADR